MQRRAPGDAPRDPGDAPRSRKRPERASAPAFFRSGAEPNPFGSAYTEPEALLTQTPDAGYAIEMLIAETISNPCCSPSAAIHRS